MRGSDERSGALFLYVDEGRGTGSAALNDDRTITIEFASFGGDEVELTAK